MIPQPPTLKEFLESSNLEVAKEPPWVHSACSGYIWDIIQSGKLIAFHVQCSARKSFAISLLEGQHTNATIS